MAQILRKKYLFHPVLSSSLLGTIVFTLTVRVCVHVIYIYNIVIYTHTRTYGCVLYTYICTYGMCVSICLTQGDLNFIFLNYRYELPYLGEKGVCLSVGELYNK